MSKFDETSKLQAGKEKDQMYCAKVVKERIQRMEQGLWLQELDQAIRDVERANLAIRDRRVSPAEDDADKLLEHNFDSCVYKTMSGDVRTGHRILKSKGVHPPSKEACDLMASKFFVEPGGDTMAGREDLRAKVKKCKTPRIEQKVLAKVIGNMKDCKAPGVSG